MCKSCSQMEKYTFRNDEISFWRYIGKGVGVNLRRKAKRLDI